MPLAPHELRAGGPRQLVRQPCLRHRNPFRRAVVRGAALRPDHLCGRDRCVTMSLMKEISIRELHRRTGAWVRNARKYGAILVRDRNVPVAKLVPVSDEPFVNRFADWKPLKQFATALDRPVAGTPVEDVIGEDRNR